MAKWRLFSKPKEETKEPTQTTQKTEASETNDKPLAQYHEILHTEGTTKGPSPKDKKQPEQTAWRDVPSIEEKIDKLHITKAKKPTTEIDKTVEKLIEKRKKK